MQRARKLSKRGLRDKAAEFIVEGATGVSEALRAGASISVVFVDPASGERIANVAADAEAKGLRVLEVSDPIMRLISGATTPPGIIAVSRFVDKPVEAVLARQFDVALVLADVRDPGNVGTILRTAWATGVGAVFMGKGSADVYNPKVVRSAAGALFDLWVAR
ncbi:MAG: TrmH family RNA methyltransferase, partial [Actinomycetota bacterium]